MNPLKFDSKTALLYVDKSGEQSSLEDVIADGLEVDYSERFPALIQLMPRARQGAVWWPMMWRTR